MSAAEQGWETFYRLKFLRFLWSNGVELDCTAGSHTRFQQVVGCETDNQLLQLWTVFHLVLISIVVVGVGSCFLGGSKRGCCGICISKNWCFRPTHHLRVLVPRVHSRSAIRADGLLSASMASWIRSLAGVTGKQATYPASELANGRQLPSGGRYSWRTAAHKALTDFFFAVERMASSPGSSLSELTRQWTSETRAARLDRLLQRAGAAIERSISERERYEMVLLTQAVDSSDAALSAQAVAGLDEGLRVLRRALEQDRSAPLAEAGPQGAPSSPAHKLPPAGSPFLRRGRPDGLSARARSRRLWSEARSASPPSALPSDGPRTPQTAGRSEQL